MNSMNDYEKACRIRTPSYDLAREFYGWMSLSVFEEKMVCSKVVRLAEMIDQKFVVKE